MWLKLKLKLDSLSQAGIMEEMMDDAFESLEDPSDDMEEEIENEVEKVLFELTAGKQFPFTWATCDTTKFTVAFTVLRALQRGSLCVKWTSQALAETEWAWNLEKRTASLVPYFVGELGKAPAAVADSLPVPEPAGASADFDDEGEVQDMQARLEALRS